MIETKYLPQRLIIYCIGLFILSLGVTISIGSNLGVSPVSSLPNAISLVTGIEFAIATVAAYSVYIVLQILILRREFKLINLTQILFSTLFGYFLNFSNLLVGGFSIPTYAGQLLMAAISIVLIAIGISLYVGAGIVPMPMEGLTLAIVQKLKTVPFHNVKIVLDSCSVLIAAGLSFAFLGGLYGVREGTVIAALLVGKCIPLVKKFTTHLVGKYCDLEK